VRAGAGREPGSEAKGAPPSRPWPRPAPLAPDSTRDLYRVRLDGSAPELVLADDPSVQLDAYGSVRLHAMSRPELTPDGTRILFVIAAGAQVVCGVSLATRKATMIASAWSWMVIPRGPFRGALLVQQSDACHVVSTTTGKSLRRVSCDQARSVGDEPSVNKTLGF
jgi:hypothetical protein